MRDQDQAVKAVGVSFFGDLIGQVEQFLQAATHPLPHTFKTLGVEEDSINSEIEMPELVEQLVLSLVYDG